MWLSELSLTNFRNYKKLKASFDPGLNVLVGKNGQGKTNIVEAIALGAYLKSFRTNTTRNLVFFGESFFRNKLTVVDNKITKTLEQYVGFEERKAVKRYWVDRVEKKATKVLGTLSVVIFSPEQLNLLLLGPDQRRRYLNLLLLQTDPHAFQKLVAYNEILKQRNALLQRISAGTAQDLELEYWNNELVLLGTEICQARQDLVSQLNESFPEHYGVISQDKEPAQVFFRDGIGAWKAKEPCSGDLFRGALAETLTKDVRRGITHRGPHRDGWEIRVGKKNLIGFGSRGELRTALLAMKFAERDLLEKIVGSKPIILLDDVMSELDAGRRKTIVSLLSGYQSFITTSEDHLLDDIPVASLYHVDSAHLEKQ